MDRTEAQLKRRLNEDQELNYPDFEQMWGRMEQAGYASSKGAAVRERIARSAIVTGEKSLSQPHSA